MSVGTYDTQLFILLAKEQGLQCASTAGWDGPVAAKREGD